MLNMFKLWDLSENTFPDLSFTIKILQQILKILSKNWCLPPWSMMYVWLYWIISCREWRTSNHVPKTPITLRPDDPRVRPIFETCQVHNMKHERVHSVDYSIKSGLSSHTRGSDDSFIYPVSIYCHVNFWFLISENCVTFSVSGSDF